MFGGFCGDFLRRIKEGGVFGRYEDIIFGVFWSRFLILGFYDIVVRNYYYFDICVNLF